MGRSGELRSQRVLRLLAWITGGLFVAILAFVIVVSFVMPSNETAPVGAEWLGLAMFPFGVFVGYVIAFRSSLLGGILALLCLVGWWAYTGFTHRIVDAVAIVSVPGILHVVYGVRARKVSASRGRRAGEGGPT